MLTVLTALLPIALILGLGKLVASYKLISAEGWIGLERITYFVLFPALIVSKLAVADFSEVDWRMPTALIGAQLTLSLVSILLAALLRQPRDRLGVFVQSAARCNTFIALALAQDIVGPAGLALVAVAAAAMIPMANIVSVTALMHYANRGVKPLQMLQQLAINPLVLACGVGLVLNVTGIVLPGTGFQVLDVLAQATIALGLLTTGAAVQFRHQTMPVTVISAWSVLRLLGLPAIAGGLAIVLGVTPEILIVVLIATAVPTAVNGTILARQLGADAGLAANLIACQTVLAIASIPLVLWAARLVT
ncbi:MAG: AEC family transporter [Pseudomonadota bacterium]